MIKVWYNENSYITFGKWYNGVNIILYQQSRNFDFLSKVQFTIFL